jgi:hypothetical protein
VADDTGRGIESAAGRIGEHNEGEDAVVIATILRDMARRQALASGRTLNVYDPDVRRRLDLAVAEMLKGMGLLAPA